MTQTEQFARYLNIRSAIGPTLSPDGSRVAYLSDTSGVYQVWSVGIDGEGEALWPRQLTFLPDKVWELHGTPAAPHLVAVSDVGGNERFQFYLISNYGVDERGRTSHTIRRLTRNDDAVHTFGAWSRDGRALLYTSNARNGVDFDLYRLAVDSGEQTLLHQATGLRSVAAWSPDERYVLSVDEVGSLQTDLYLLDLARGEERCLSSGRPPARYLEIRWSDGGLFLLTDAQQDRGALCRLDPETGALTELLDGAAEPGEGEMELLAVSSDGRTAAFTRNVDGWSRLYLLDLQNSGRRRIETLPAGVIGSLRFDARDRTVVLHLQSPNAPPDIYSVQLRDGSSRRLTFSNNAGIDLARFVAPVTVHYPSFDGLSIPALYFRPAGPEPADGFPCLLYVHGGPAGQLRPEFLVMFQYLLARGYALLAPNVRGSTGYGRTYTELDEVERRMDSVADLEAAVQWLHSRLEIDNRRIAIYGRSYGGFMVLAAMTEYPHLFAAGVDVVGIANWITFLERTGPWRRAHREREYGSLAHHRAFLESISPIHRVERIRVPLLVQAGDNDPRVPLHESQQVVERIQNAGGPVEFVHYADEGHIFSKLANRIDSFTQMAAFLDRHLQPVGN